MPTDPTPYPDDEIDLRQLAATLWDGRWWIIVTTLLCSAIAVAYALLATPIYRAEACAVRTITPNRAHSAR